MNKVLEILYEQLELNADDMRFAEGVEREDAEVYNLQLQEAIKILEESERQESTEHSDKHDSKALHIADVSGRFSNSWNFAKYFEETEQYKRLTEVQKVEKDRIFLTATKIYDWLVSLNDR